MRFIYPAIIRKIRVDLYEARVPDLEGCIAAGFSEDDVMIEINAAMLAWITLELEEEEQPQLPPISEAEDLKHQLREDEFIRNVCVTYRSYDGWDE